jgi:hypothetical protein
MPCNVCRIIGKSLAGDGFRRGPDANSREVDFLMQKYRYVRVAICEKGLQLRETNEQRGA